MDPSAYRILQKVLQRYNDFPPDVARLRECLQLVSPQQRFDLLKSESGFAMISQAVQTGQIEVLSCLLGSVTAQQIYDWLRTQDNAGGTALHYAVWKDNPQSIMCILDSVTPTQQIKLLNAVQETNECDRVTGDLFYEYMSAAETIVQRTQREGTCM